MDRAMPLGGVVSEGLQCRCEARRGYRRGCGSEQSREMDEWVEGWMEGSFFFCFFI